MPEDAFSIPSGPPSTEAVSHGKRRPRSATKTIIGLIAACLAVLMVSSITVATYAVGSVLGSIKSGVKLKLADANGTPIDVPNVSAASGAINILIAGTDTRSGQGGEFSSPDQLAGSSGIGSNDVTMVLHLSADHESATVISIPRDLITDIPACTSPNGYRLSGTTAMFNETLARGGLGCVVATAEELTGLTIPFAAEITFDGVIAMSNAIGGVSVCLASPIDDRYVGLTLPAGEQTLQGDQALAFVRSRHGFGDGSDLGRISNQQLFLAALMRKVTSTGTLANPLTLYSLALTATQNVQLSETLTSPTTLVSIALALKNVPLSRFVFLQYPTGNDPDAPERVIANDDAVSALKAALSTDAPVLLSGTTGVAAETTQSPTANAPAGSPAPGETDSAASAASLATPVPSNPSTGMPAPGTSLPASNPVSATDNSNSAIPAPTDTPLPTDITGQTAAEQTCTKGDN